VELISKSLAALVEATIDLTVSNPSKANKYRDSGFKCLGRHNQAMSLCIL